MVLLMCLTEYDSRVRLGAFGLAMEWNGSRPMQKIEDEKKYRKIFKWFFFLTCNGSLTFFVSVFR